MSKDSVHRCGPVIWPSRLLLARWARVVRKIRSLEVRLRRLTDADLRRRSTGLRHQARAGQRLAPLLPEAFALVSESAARQLGMRPYDVQLLGAIAMHHGLIAEMQTGEGKTLTATMPVYLNALAGQGVHVATANDYLARRDADWMRPVYESLGLSVGYVQSQMPRPLRREAYGCDITYGTAKEFGFDLLRDRLSRRGGLHQPHQGLAKMLAGTKPPRDDAPVQRRARLALVDEADSVLIDEAQTPLIISGDADRPGTATAACYQWCADVASQFVEGSHYWYEPDKKKVELSADGRQLVHALPKPTGLGPIRLTDLFESIERAIQVERDYVRDRHYVVRDGEVVIVDEFTGRLGEGRQWRDGIHQAVQAKEGLPVTVARSQHAQITLQQFFSLYPRLAGTTGTARSSRKEFRQVYGLPVVPIPPHRACRRVHLPDEVLPSEEAKWAAIVREVRRMQQQGRPVLIGTRSIDKSEQLSRQLEGAGVAHEVLNAKQDREEARIIAEAGRRGKVTVATNMAGRGTDIRLGRAVAELGGLHVICSELHDSPRIDRQLAGRAARQGDPGTVRQFLSLDDEILAAGFGAAKAQRVKQRALRASGSLRRFAKRFRTAQRRVVRTRLRARRRLMRDAQQQSELLERMGLDPYLGYF